MISLSKARKDIFQLFTDCLADVTLNDKSVPVYDCIPPSDVNQGVLYENRYLEQPTTTMTGETHYHLVQCTTTVFSFIDWETTEKICDLLCERLNGKGDNDTFQMIICHSFYYMDFVEEEGFFGIQIDWDIILYGNEQ